MKKNIKQSKKKKQFNLYGWTNKHKKAIVGTVCIVIVFTMLIGTLSSVLLTL